MKSRIFTPFIMLAICPFFTLAVITAKSAVAGENITAENVGVRMEKLFQPSRKGEIEVTIWYPAETGGSTVQVGSNKIFKGVQANQNAPIAAGRYPLVLMSHGGIRSAPHLGGWISRYLAERGYIVVVPRPPRLSYDEAHKAVNELWLRPEDLSLSLDWVLSKAELAEHVVKWDVRALGFYLGGSSMLMLAGAQLDPERYSHSCDEGSIGLDCGWFIGSGVDLKKINLSKLTEIATDDRIQTVVAVDPELSTSMIVNSLSTKQIPVSIITLGHSGSILPALNASNLTNIAPNIRYLMLPDASQYSAFSQCTQQGAELLSNDGEAAAICGETEGLSRADIQLKLAAMIENSLTRNVAKNGRKTR